MIKKDVGSKARHLPIGAEPQAAGIAFRVWAPHRQNVAVVGQHNDVTFEIALTAEGNGYFSGLVAAAAVGALYHYRLDHGQALYADPASRYQPQGPNGPSAVTDPAAFQWHDDGWNGIKEDRHVLYELHIGTFTQEGSWPAAACHLAQLKELGVTTLQIMPVADFPGRFGWGYDGINIFAPSRLYGYPDDFKAFIDQAHGLGLAVILDVVYNHFGPGGEYLKNFSPAYFTDKYKVEWGEAINFDGPENTGVREYVLANVRYWIEEFHLDGLRLDATQNIYDDSESHILKEIIGTVRHSARGRHTLVIVENEAQNSLLLTSTADGGMDFNAALNDDFHHTARVALTGHSEAYFQDYKGTPQEFMSLAKYGYLFQGQYYYWQHKKRGRAALFLPPFKFVHCLENHDQLANAGRGFRLHQLSSPGGYRALTAMLILFPQTPMLFQGQEFASAAPFNYFADNAENPQRNVTAERIKSLSQFPSLATPEMKPYLPTPEDEAVFKASKLQDTERAKNRTTWQLHQDLLTLRRDDAVLGKSASWVDGAILGQEAFLLRYFGEDGDDRLLLVNLGKDLALNPAPEPLLAPPLDRAWTLLWSSENPAYGGHGTPLPENNGAWHLGGCSAIVMMAVNQK